MTPIISVLMPVYNGDLYVAEALESILNQTFRDFEFIIIDDGSTDRSHSILESYSNKDRRIRLVSRPNTGLTKALNEGISLSIGEFIARMDSDDVSHPQRFASQIDYMRLNPDCVAVGTMTTLVDADGWELENWEGPIGHEEIDATHLSKCSGCIAHPSVMIRRSALLKVGGYRAEFETAQDLDLWLRLAEVGRLGNVGRRLLMYRVHSGSISAKRGQQQFGNGWKAVCDAYQRRRLPNPPGPPMIPSPQLSDDPAIILAYQAFGGRFYQTSAKHAGRYLLRHPWSIGTWKLWAKAMVLNAWRAG